MASDDWAVMADSNENDDKDDDEEYKPDGVIEPTKRRKSRPRKSVLPNKKQNINSDQPAGSSKNNAKCASKRAPSKSLSSKKKKVWDYYFRIPNCILLYVLL